MGDFRLGKTAVLGKAPVSTGFKLGMGKVPQCMFGVHINSPTGNVMALHDAYRGKCFEGGDAGLAGYPYRAEITYKPSVGGSEGYQFLVKTYYAKDAEHGGDAENVNGTEVLDGEPTPIPKIYLNRLCRWDFGDVRFQLKGVVGASAYTYRLIEKVDGVWALFMFKMNENPDSARTVCCYWGKQTAVDESSDLAAEAIIPNVVGAWGLDEADEADSVVTPWDSGFESSIVGWSQVNSTSFTRSTEQAYVGSYSFKIKRNDLTGRGGVSYSLGALTVGKRYRLSGVYKMVNGTSGTCVKLTSNASASYLNGTTYTDQQLVNASAWTAFSIEVVASALSGGNINAVWLGHTMADTSTEFYVDELELTLLGDSGVTAIDRSGNGNNGTATGTTITASPFFAGKNARQFNGITDKITIPSPASLDFTDTMSILVLTKPSTGTGQQGIISVGTDWRAGFSVYVRHYPGADLGACFNPNGTVAISKGGTVNYGAKNLLGFIYDGTDCKGVINNSIITNASSQNSTRYFGDINIGYAGGIIAPNYLNGIIDSVIIIHGVVTQENIDAIYNSGTFNYPDPRLIEGSVVVRKWASTTLPTVASVGSMQVRKSYGKQELYPAIDNLNFTLDQANKKASIEFYLENTQLRSPNTLILSEDDGASYWTIQNEGTGTFGVEISNDTTDTPNGSAASLKITSITSTYDHCYLKKTFASPQNWTTYDFIGYYVKGKNSGRTRGFQIWTGDISGTNRLRFSVVDNFIGWKLCVFPILSPTASSGTPNLADVRAVILWDMYAADFTGENWVKYDSFALDVGVWAKLEIGVPDKLQTATVTGYPATTYDIDKILTYVWDGSAWAEGVKVDANHYWQTSTSKFLNGTTFKDVYGEAQTYESLKCATLFIKGKRGETKGRKSTHMANQTITYNKAKTKYRVGFAIKMPPADLNASATTGIGQCKLKLEVYYI